MRGKNRNSEYSRKALACEKRHRQVDLWEWYAANLVGKTFNDYDHCLAQADALQRIVPETLVVSIHERDTGWFILIADAL